MKIELNISPELVDLIAEKVSERLNPLVTGNGKQGAEDVIFDIPALVEYLKVSKQWIYERTRLKEIPHVKIDGQLRFRKKEIDRWLNSFNVPATNGQDRIFKGQWKG